MCNLTSLTQFVFSCNFPLAQYILVLFDLSKQRARIWTENLRTTYAPRTSGLYGKGEGNGRTKILLESASIRSYSGSYSIRTWKDADQNNSE